MDDDTANQDISEGTHRPSARRRSSRLSGHNFFIMKHAPQFKEMFHQPGDKRKRWHVYGFYFETYLGSTTECAADEVSFEDAWGKKGSRRARLVPMRRHQHLAATRWRLTVPRAPVDFFSYLRTLLVFLFIKPHLLSVQFSDDTSIPVIKSQPATPSGFSPQMTPAGNPVSQATNRWALLP